MKTLFLFLFLVSSILFAQDTKTINKTRPIVSSGNMAQNSIQKNVVQVGQDIDLADPYMDALYQRGSFLVYDCVTRHWVCTQVLEYDRCVMNRKEALLDLKTILPCAHFDKFELRQDCKKRQQELTDVAKYEKFCFHPSKIENTIDF